MLKVTITFPSGVSISLETTESEKFGEIIASTHQFLAMEDGRASVNGSSNGSASNANGATGNGVATTELQQQPVTSDGHEDAEYGVSDENTSADESENGNGHLVSSPEFLEFCQMMAPSGDMRRVVVAAEGA